MKNFATFLFRYRVLALVFCWLLVQAGLYATLGVQVVFDSRRYLAGAQSLAQSGQIGIDRGLAYLSYLVFLTVFLKFKASLQFVILVQVLLSGVAAIYFYRLAHLVASRQVYALAATFFFIAWPDLQRWNFYIHTESVFISLLVIYTYFLFTHRGRKKLLICASLLLLLLFCRPNGFIVVLATLFYFGVKGTQNMLLPRFQKQAGFFILGLFVLLLSFAVQLANSFFQTKGTAIIPLIEAYNSGAIIDGYSGWILHASHKLWTPTPEFNPVLQMMLYGWHNPFYFLKLCGLKLLVFFAQVKPYYSLWHNACLVLFVYPVYFLVLKAGITRKEKPGFKIYLVTLIGLQAIISAVTLLDWDNRFVIIIFPFILLLACSSGKNAASKLRSNLQE